jgi:DNA-binding response OmpR family regulator
MKILVIEDEAGIAEFIYQGLKETGYLVDLAEDGAEGKERFANCEYDLIILDILLPKIDGLTLLGEMRSQKNLTPVLLLTAMDSVEDRVKGLDRGADDYLVKPFAFSELLARIRALQRRPPLQQDTILQVGDLVMDLVTREVRRNRSFIELSPLEFNLLEYLMSHAEQALTRNQIGEHVWNLDYYSNSNVVDVYIGYLRKKIDQGTSQPLIHTVRGIGYCLKADAIDG